MVLPTRVFAELAVWTAGLEVVAEGALGGGDAGAEEAPVGLTTVAVLVLVLEMIAVTFP
jgi:hypothetical protein